MNLYKISQTENDDYDTYDSAVVAAETEDDARMITPDAGQWGKDSSHWCNWCSSPELVTVELIGVAKPFTEAGVICASYNAG